MAKHFEHLIGHNFLNNFFKLLRGFINIFFFEKKCVPKFKTRTPNARHARGMDCPPSCRFCQLSAINADYRGPRPAPRTSRRWGVAPCVRPAQGTGEVAPNPRMVSDSQSAPIRAIGGRLKIRGHPAPRVGEFADRGEWPRTEGADLRRRPSSEGLRVRQVF